MGNIKAKGCASQTLCLEEAGCSTQHEKALPDDNELYTILEDAIKNKRFQVYYQPIYSFNEKKFVSAEALIRLFNEKYGAIPPDIFIPLAERTGIIHPIGDFVTEEVFKFMASEEFKQLNLNYVEINLSVTQCMAANLADKIIQLMKHYDIDPRQINFEITETAASFAQNIMERNLLKLSDSGVGFSLDDYGSGYSNIKRMVQLPLKIVKLDKLFVDGLADNKMLSILHNTVQMIKDIDMEIVVEGVETSEAFRLFKDLNCEHIQGYYFCKPLPKEQFVTFITNFNDI